MASRFMRIAGTVHRALAALGLLALWLLAGVPLRDASAVRAWPW